MENNYFALYHNAHKEFKQKAKYLQLCYSVEDVACTDKARQEGHLESISLSLQEGAENLGFTEFTDFSRKEWSILLHLLLEIRKWNLIFDLHSLTVSSCSSQSVGALCCISLLARACFKGNWEKLPELQTWITTHGWAAHKVSSDSCSICKFPTESRHWVCLSQQPYVTNAPRPEMHSSQLFLTTFHRDSPLTPKPCRSQLHGNASSAAQSVAPLLDSCRLR